MTLLEKNISRPELLNFVLNNAHKIFIKIPFIVSFFFFFKKKRKEKKRKEKRRK